MEEKDRKELKKIIASTMQKRDVKEMLVGVIVLIVLAVGVIWLITKIIVPKTKESFQENIIGEEGEATVSVFVSLTDVVKSCKLYTAEYPYHGYTAVKEEGTDNIKYYVRYSGSVKAGLDMDAVTATVDEENHVIKVYLPEVKIESAQINSADLDFIFEKEKYHTETVFLEGAEKAQEDLQSKAEADINITRLATENAKILEESMIKAWVAGADPEHVYTVKVIAFGEEE